MPAAAYCRPLPMPSSTSSAQSRRLPRSGGRTGGNDFGDDVVALFDVFDVSVRIAFVVDAPHRHVRVNVVIVRPPAGGGLLVRRHHCCPLPPLLLRGSTVDVDGGNNSIGRRQHHAR